MDQPASPRSLVHTPLSRRGPVRSAAWSVPVVSLASAAPAFAVSGTPDDWQVTTPTTVEVQRCAVVSGQSVVARTTSEGATVNVPTGAAILFTLPTGLEFVGGGQTRQVTLDASAPAFTAVVPDFQVTGTAGTYSVTAQVVGTAETATFSVVATPAPGSLYLLPMTPTIHSTAPATRPPPSRTSRTP